MAEDHGINAHIAADTSLPDVPLFAIYTDAAGETDGLAHFVPDGQFNSPDMVSLCGIHSGNGTWTFDIGMMPGPESPYMLPLCPKCRAAEKAARS